MLLKFVKTDAGRARAWLRSSLNEHSLERYFHMMINGFVPKLILIYVKTRTFHYLVHMLSKSSMGQKLRTGQQIMHITTLPQ